jgi:hypothetical protein
MHRKGQTDRRTSPYLINCNAFPKSAACSLSFFLSLSLWPIPPPPPPPPLTIISHFGSSFSSCTLTTPHLTPFSLSLPRLLGSLVDDLRVGLYGAVAVRGPVVPRVVLVLRPAPRGRGLVLLGQDGHGLSFRGWRRHWIPEPHFSGPTSGSPTRKSTTSRIHFTFTCSQRNWPTLLHSSRLTASLLSATAQEHKSTRHQGCQVFRTTFGQMDLRIRPESAT